MTASIVATDETILSAARILRQGGIVAFPTETVYGLGAGIHKPEAAARVFEVKERPRFDPLIVHISRASDLHGVARSNDLAKRLGDVFWPGPLTLVLPKKEAVPDIVTAGLATVAVRVPDNDVALRLIDLTGHPVAAPSANRFGCISPTTAAHVAEKMGGAVDMILDGGPCRIGLESTILAIDQENHPILLRPGGIPVQEIEKIIGPVALRKHTDTVIRAPGMLPRHYAPRTPVHLLNDTRLRPIETDRRIGLLTLDRPEENLGYRTVEVLSRTGDLREASANLFAAMHRLDAAGLDLIHCRPVPETGLGAAIMDRLRRAACSGHGASHDSESNRKGKQSR
ncbi:MAG: L-threonylcarbamoyladenylate synthase [Thermodesulfobacteriota bacterium]